MPHSTCLDDAQVAALAAGESAAREALAHVEECAACRELVSAIAATRTDADRGDRLRLAPDTVLGRHRILRPLGAGGMGVVYLARDVELDRDVAIKLLRNRDDDAHTRLARESQALAKLNHPNVVTAYETGRHGDTSYLIMEYVGGGTVREWLAAEPRDTAAIAGVFEQAARGLAAAHAAGFVHRDVKPDNVLIGDDGRARISDFGLAGPGGAERGTEGRIVGTVRYMAPEVLAGAIADARADQWSLGASLWEALFGAPPFTSSSGSREELAGAIAHGLPPLPRDVPSWLRVALVRSLRTDPADRFASLDAFADALAPRRSPLRRALPIVLAIVIALTAGGIAGLLGARARANSCIEPLVWGSQQRTILASHVRGLGGSAMLVSAGPGLDRYATGWSAQRDEVCRASSGDPVRALRAACLDRRRRAFVALVDELDALAPTGVTHIAHAVADLPPLDDCAATERLAGRQPEPRDPVERVQLAQLEHRYATALAQTDLGNLSAAQSELFAVGADAERLRYFPLAADALGAVGRADSRYRRPSSLATLRRALVAAESGGDDQQLMEGSLDMAFALTDLDRPLEERDVARGQLAGAIARLSWRGDRSAVSGNAAAELLYGYDDQARGNLVAAEREYRRSIALGVVAFGARSERIATGRSRLAQLLVARGEYDEGAALLAQAVDVDDNGWGAFADDLVQVGGGAESQELIDAAYRLVDVGHDQEVLAFVAKAMSAPSTAMSRMVFDDLRAQIALDLGDLKTAFRFNAEAVREIGPNASIAHLSGSYVLDGDIRLAAGDTAGAERAYGAAMPGLGRDEDSRQHANLGIAECRIATGDRATAKQMVEAVLAAGMQSPRDQLRALRLAADLRWTSGDRAGAIAAIHAAQAQLVKLPALTAERAAVASWIAAHPVDRT